MFGRATITLGIGRAAEAADDSMCCSDEGQSSSVDRQQTLELCQDLQLGLNTKQLLPQLIVDEL